MWQTILFAKYNALYLLFQIKMLTFTQQIKTYIAKVSKKGWKATKRNRKMSKMTLKDYYDSLERPVPPKKEFITKVAERCGVDCYTVRLWISGKSKPSKSEYYQVLSEESGVPVNELFSEDV